MVTLIFECPPDVYERIESEGLSVIHGSLREVEIRQTDGLLNFKRRVLAVEPMSNTVAMQYGVADQGGPPIRLYLAEEASDG